MTEVPGRILIVDDDDALRAVLREMLEWAAFDVGEAPDGERALEQIGSAAFDLVVCDIFMPIREGIETIRRIRALRPELRILAVSGGGTRGRLEYLQIARQLGADRVLAKPFGHAELLEVVAELLGEPSRSGAV